MSDLGWRLAVVASLVPLACGDNGGTGSAIVERHGGRIFVESEPDRGSLFVVELPLAPPECALDDMP